MKTFLLIYFGIGLVCAIVAAYSYWNSNGYTTGDKVKSTLAALFFWWALLLCIIFFWVGDYYLSWRAKRSKKD